jgi:Asp-tRNA(Asn)/Glu-tRNA(Gln) amidotransferase C subunit
MPREIETVGRQEVDIASQHDDQPREELGRDEALGPAPDHAEGLFRVPRILP